MSVRLTRFRFNHRGLQQILTSQAMQDDVGDRASRMADQVEAAGIRVEGEPGRLDLPVTVTVTAGDSRARARVILDHAAGQAVEAKHGLLAAAVDAARDPV